MRMETFGPVAQGKTPHPMLGFASYGEIARHTGSTQGFRNATAVNAVW